MLLSVLVMAKNTPGPSNSSIFTLLDFEPFWAPGVKITSILPASGIVMSLQLSSLPAAWRAMIIGYCHLSMYLRCPLMMMGSRNSVPPPSYYLMVTLADFKSFLMADLLYPCYCRQLIVGHLTATLNSLMAFAANSVTLSSVLSRFLKLRSKYLMSMSRYGVISYTNTFWSKQNEIGRLPFV